MKTVILYRSRHHGNTRKLVEAIVAAYPGTDAIDVGSLGRNEFPDISGYHLIGIASGIYYSAIDKGLIRVAERVLRSGDKVFGLMTYGGKNRWYGKDIDGTCRMRQATFLGAYGCIGFDTWGPFRLRGGLHKGHPDDEDIAGAVEFYGKLLEEYGDIIDEEYEKRERRLAFESENPRGGLVSLIRRTASKIAHHLS